MTIIPNIVEDLDTRPEEWIVLERGAGTDPGIRVIEYELNTGHIRVSGPVVVSNPPHAPAP